MGDFRTLLRTMQTLLHRAELLWCVIGLLSCTFLVFIQVVNRWLIRYPLMGVGDLALYVFIGFMLIAAAYTTWNEGHISVDAFRDKLVAGRPRAAAGHKVAMVLIAIAVCLSILPATYDYMTAAIRYPQYGTLVRWFNTSWLQVLVFVMLFLLLLHLVVIAQRDIANLIHQRRHRGKD